MKSRRLTQADNGETIATELAIVGAGPVGLAIADRCARAGMEVLLIESGLEQEDAAHEELNRTNRVGLYDQAARAAFHGSQAPLWDGESQQYGVRCRGLGGSTQAWAGKSAAFDAIDFERRDWIAGSGWPIGPSELARYIDEAGGMLGLCPEEPDAAHTSAGLRSFYWQFARSRVDRLDIMRFGRDFAAGLNDRVTCLLDATVTRIVADQVSGTVIELVLANRSGASVKVNPRRVVLAAGAIENARLLLASPQGRTGQAFNRYDNLGRYLIDHASARLGLVTGAQTTILARRFGFSSRRHGGRAHMFQHGLALSPDVQRAEKLANGALWFAQMRAPDNPWDALNRLLRGQSESWQGDLATTLRGSGLILRGTAARALASPRCPETLRRAMVEAAVRVSPNAAAVEFQTGGLPHKLCGLSIEGIVETVPRATNRITLSSHRDALDQLIPVARWELGETEHRTLRRLAGGLAKSFCDDGQSLPQPEPWTKDPSLPVPVIDCAHSMGTTRMADDPRHGVVDSDCRVFGSTNLYAAGGSVFPTGGHANPTWMFLALALRLGEHLASLPQVDVSDPKRSSRRQNVPIPV